MLIIIILWEIHRRLYGKENDGFQDNVLPNYFDALKKTDCADLLIEEKEFSKYGVQRFTKDQIAELERVASSKDKNQKIQLNPNYQVTHNLDYTLEFRN